MAFGTSNIIENCPKCKGTHIGSYECPIFCIACANGNDLPEGEYCRACGRGYLPNRKPRTEIPKGMFSPALSKEDARTILCGLFPAGIDVSRLSNEAKSEIRAAIEVVLANQLEKGQ